MGKHISHTDTAPTWRGAVHSRTRTPVDIDLVTVVVWVTAARIFVPDLRQAGRRLIAAAVRAGVRHLHQQNTPLAPAAHASFDAATQEGEA